MRQFMIFAARYVFLITLLLFILAGSVKPQSTERDNPTPLNSDEIAGVIAHDNQKITNYYSFMAGPGEVKITLTVDPGQEYKVNGVSFELFDEDARTITRNSTNALLGRAGQVIERVNLKRRQQIVLGIQVLGGESGNYRLRLSGAIDISSGKSSSPRRLNQSTIEEQLLRESWPKRGILRIKMKDGSVKRIDLSQVEEIGIDQP